MPRGQMRKRQAPHSNSRALGAPKVSRCKFKDIREKEKGPSGIAGSPAEPAAAPASARAPAASASAGQPANVPEMAQSMMVGADAL
eukprot:5992512-Pyramimonas_sp.AAC.1